MHIQARSGTGSAAMTDDDDDDLLVNATYGGGGLAQILAVLEDNGFNIRGASGHRIELDGVFSWRVAKRPGDADEDEATKASAAIVAAAGFDADWFEVENADLDDQPGALRAFVEHINEHGGMVEELSVGTPNADGTIPVQAWVSRQG